MPDDTNDQQKINETEFEIYRLIIGTKNELNTIYSVLPANDFSFSFLIFSLFLDKRKIIRLISYEKYFLKRYFS